MTEKYIHFAPGDKVESISGHYMIQREERIDYKGRQVLVLFGYGIIEHSCCGSGAGCRFARIPGYVISWKSGTADSGEPVTEVEPIESEDEMAEISDIVDKMECHCQINFD